MKDSPLLQVRNLDVYYGNIIALKGVSFDLYPGQLATMLGANGAGKTTLLKTLSGIINPQLGTIHFKGEAIERASPENIVRSGIVHVPEGREIFPFLSVAENLQMGAFTRKGTSVIQSDIELIYDYFPVLKSLSKQQAGYLSGGQQQMLAIGRALMSRPQLMLLDEPSLGLSPRLVKEMMTIVTRLNTEQQVTIMLVEQNAQQALGIANYGFVLEVGRLVMADRVERLLESSDIKEFYLGDGQDDGQLLRSQRRWKRKKTWR